MAANIKIAELDGNQSFYFEEDVAETGALENVGIGDLAGKVDFDEALATVRHAAEKMAASLISLASAPSGVEITFGIKLSTAVGAIIAKAGAEANFTIKLSWAGKKD